uniref:Uncharacterized protein n=1 Tax=Sphaerodactylus townsendi TaxID=933632 RepID=A0ACB8EBK8_9SAUR
MGILQHGTPLNESLIAQDLRAGGGKQSKILELQAEWHNCSLAVTQFLLKEPQTSDDIGFNVQLSYESSVPRAQEHEAMMQRPGTATPKVPVKWAAGQIPNRHSHILAG